jgi:hypothetical protein
MGPLLQRLARACVLAWAAVAAGVPPAVAERPHNVILFVPDGLRALMVDERTAPAMAAVRDKGVNFKNPHSLFPTFTTPNASAMATGHYLGDTGDFSNVIYTGLPIGGTLTPFLESDPVLGDVDAHFAGDYLDEVTLLKAARKAGLSTATIGKLGPALIFDHTERTGTRTVVFDDSTGSANGIPLAAEIEQRLRALDLPLATPSRGDNGDPGTAERDGAKTANLAQQNYFVEVAAKVVLPLFKARARPFVLVFWSRDPDGTQHNQGDSRNALVPGINGPTSLAAIKNADDDLARLETALAELGLADSTDIFVSADHGFSTIAKESKTSPAARATYADVPAGLLPPGFLAIDLATALNLPLYDPDAGNAPVERDRHPTRANGLIGRDPAHPEIVVAANGGSDLVYIVNKDRELTARVINALLAQDYVSGIFVDDSLGRLPGTLPLTAVNLQGSALTPMPTIAVNFRSFATGCAQPVVCTVEIADTVLQQGQGMHGSLSRADTMNFMAAIGPDFKKGFVDEAPASNADVGKTLARILGLKTRDHGKLTGRVLSEAMPGGKVPRHVTETARSDPTAAGLATVLNYQRIGKTRYFDAAGFPERTVGLVDDAPRAKN